MSETDKAQDDEKIDTVAQAEANAPKPFSTVGATEDETADRDREIAPGFTDMEPGAGPDYGPTDEPGPNAPEDPNQQKGQGFTAPEVTGETEDSSKSSED